MFHSIPFQSSPPFQSTESIHPIQESLGTRLPLQCVTIPSSGSTAVMYGFFSGTMSLKDGSKLSVVGNLNFLISYWLWYLPWILCLRRNFKIWKSEHHSWTSGARGTLVILPSKQCNEDEHQCRLHEWAVIASTLLIQQESKEHLVVMNSPPAVNIINGDTNKIE